MSEKSDILIQASQLLSDLFGLDADDLTLQTTRDSIPAWDSLQHMNLVLDVERQFQIRLSEEQVAAIESVGDLVTAISNSLDSQRQN